MTPCSQCGQPISIGEWPFCPHGYAGEGNAQHFEPVVYFEDAGGNRLFPGRTSERPPVGYTRKELTTISAVRAFEKSENRKLYEQHHDSKMREQIVYDLERKPKIEAVRARMSSMSPAERACAERLLERVSRRSFSSEASRYDAGFHVEPFSRDASNRRPWNDVDAVGRRNRR